MLFILTLKLIKFLFYYFSPSLANAHSFILVHNHPSGDQQPTKEDHKITEEMIEVGRLMQIPLKDHVIIWKDWLSFNEINCREDG